MSSKSAPPGARYFAFLCKSAALGVRKRTKWIILGRFTTALLGQLLQTAPEVYLILDRYAKPGVK